MSATFLPMIPPPLPAGWTTHMSPTGQPYYYNTSTKESTYVRPLPSFHNMPSALPAKAKKEKPLVKTLIPGTGWLRVVTTEGNTFYTNKAEKKSVWTIPDEIKDAVALMEEEAAMRREVSALQAKGGGASTVDEESLKEIERVKSELQEMVGKRKADDLIPLDEVATSKRARVEDEGEGEDGGESEGENQDEDVDQEDGEDDEGDESGSSEEEGDHEHWRHAATAQPTIAQGKEGGQTDERRQEEHRAQQQQLEADAQKTKPLNIPDRVDLSLEEAKALFKTLLREKNINPLHPWDTSLPLFVSDPRYVLLPSVSARREAFDEYCRDRARELRQAQLKKETLSPKEEFEKLLSEEVKSTRTSWTEWRRQWKKDRRFYNWGRDDREREKRFREFLKELGEKKRVAAQKAETDFLELLKEKTATSASTSWKEVKGGLADDPRYDAVGSSSLREELFNAFLKAGVTSLPKGPNLCQPQGQIVSEDLPEAERNHQREERKKRAVKLRGEKVEAERNKVEATIDKSRQGLNRSEYDLEFRALLVDAIRDPLVIWETASHQLKIDPRFTNSQLPISQQLNLFREHVGQLRLKHLKSLRALFLSHAPILATPFTALPVSSILSSLPATKLGHDIQSLEAEYERWQRERVQEARRAFDEMLSENSFVEFWGRLGKIGGKGVDQSIKADDIGEDAEEIVDMKVLAKTVDLKEMVKVLKNDSRYLAFNHVPEQREQWLRDYLTRLSAPKLSVHMPESS